MLGTWFRILWKIDTWTANARLAGYGYASFSPKLRDWVANHSGDMLDWNQPILADPGTDFNYGVSSLLFDG